MSRTEIAFLIALSVTLIFSTVIVICLSRVLQHLLVDLCGSAGRARFWSRFTNILLFLVPFMAILLGRTTVPSLEPVLFQVADQFKWALLGLVGTLAFVAATVNSFVRWIPRDAVRMSPEQLDGLQRLLSRVEEIRAGSVEPPEYANVADG